MHPKIAALVKNLHDGCWLAYDELSTVVHCSKGVRQSLPASSGELWDRDTAVVTARARSRKDRVSCITTLKKFWMFTSWTMAAT